MKSIGVIANCRKPEAGAVLQRLALKAGELKLKLFAPAETARLLPGARAMPESSLARRVDALIALGGDGTLLSAVRMLGESDTPVLGVNLGNLGFLTSVTLGNLERAMEILARGHFEVSARTTLDCTLLRNKKTMGRYRALNDVVIGWGYSSRINTFDVLINGEHVTSYRCDGLIISTPTGTTGHSLSAGGPILHPATPALLVNVICPHTLSARPLVVEDRSKIIVDITETSKKLLLSVDGQEEHPVTKGDRLAVSRGRKTVRFIHLPGYSYFSVLRQKLNWRGSSVQ
jgi:NAD+ kinase